MPQLIASVQDVEVKHVFLHKDRTTLGRKPDNDIVLDTMVVSGHHCAFDLVGLADVYVEDLGSTNGTFVNDRVVKQRTRLHDGDLVAIGPYRIRYLQASEEPSAFGSTQQLALEPVPLSARLARGGALLPGPRAARGGQERQRRCRPASRWCRAPRRGWRCRW